MSAFLLQAGASARWELSWPTWLVAVARWGPLLLAALAALLVLRALLHRRRYRAESALDPAARERVRAAVADAERGSCAELVVVVLERSDDHADADWLAALCAMLLGTALLVADLPWNRPELVLLAQLGLLAAGFLLARLLPEVARSFTSEARATGTAHEQALIEFQRHGLHRTAGRNGTLLFVSLFERRVVVLGDEAVHAKVGEPHWTATTQAVLQGVAAGRLADGLVAGVQACGAVLAANFPRGGGDVNELPDHLIVRRR
jgi:putative membrane protein